MANIFTLRSKRGGNEFKTRLRAWCEDDGDLTPDDYSRNETDAVGLFKLRFEENRATWASWMSRFLTASPTTAGAGSTPIFEKKG